MIIFPTRGRPQNLKRFIRAYADTRATEPVLVIVDRCDDKLEEYKEIEMPNSFLADIVTRVPLTETINNAFIRNPNQPYYAVVCDDVVPSTPAWDKILSDIATCGRISWGRDGIQNEQLPTHPFISGDIVRRLGWVLYPECKQQYADTVLGAIARASGLGKYCDYVKMTHHHYINGRAEMDKTYKECPDPKQDAKVFEEFMANHLETTIKRLAV